MGVGKVDFAEVEFECTRGCGTGADMDFLGILLGGLSNSTISALDPLCVKIEGQQWARSGGTKLIDIDSERNYKIYHNQYFLFKETKDPFLYKRLKVNTW